MKTLTQIEQYVRAETGELDSGKVDSEQIKNYVNYSQNEVQTDFFKRDFKTFTRTAFYTGATFLEPSDLMQFPNSVINLLASAGTVRAFKSVAYTTPTAEITHTYREPGTGGNAVDIVCDASTYGSASATGTVVVTFAGNKWYLDFFVGDTITVIVAAFNADPLYSKYFICSSSTAGATIPAPAEGQSLDLAGGTGAGWYPADEVSNENFIRISSNTYKAPSATSPKYRRIGSPLSTQQRMFQVLPNTTTFCELEYYNRLVDLSASTDTLDVPPEIEEMILLKVQKRIYEKVGNTEKVNAAETEYQNKFKQYVSDFIDTRKSQIAEEERIQSF